MKKQISIATIASLALSVLVGVASAPAAQAVVPDTKKLSALVVENLDGPGRELVGTVSRMNPPFDADSNDYVVVTGDYSVTVAATVNAGGNANAISFTIDGKAPSKLVSGEEQLLNPVVSGQTATQEFYLSTGAHDIEIDVDGNVYNIALGHLAVPQPRIVSISETSGPLWGVNLVDFRMNNVPYLGYGPESPSNSPWNNGNEGTNPYWKDSACMLDISVGSDSTFTDWDKSLDAPIQGVRIDSRTGDTIVTAAIPAGAVLGAISAWFEVKCRIITDWDSSNYDDYEYTLRSSANVAKDFYTYVETSTAGIEAEIPTSVTLGSGIEISGTGMSHHSFDDPDRANGSWEVPTYTALRAYLVDPNYVPDSMVYADYTDDGDWGYVPALTRDNPFEDGEYSNEVPFLNVRSWGYANETSAKLYVPRDPHRSFGYDTSEIFYGPAQLKLMVIRCNWFPDNEFDEDNEVDTSEMCDWETPVYSSTVNWAGMEAKNISFSPQSAGLDGAGTIVNERIKNGVTIRGRNLFTNTYWNDALGATYAPKVVDRGPDKGKLVDSRPSASTRAKMQERSLSRDSISGVQRPDSEKGVASGVIRPLDSWDSSLYANRWYTYFDWSDEDAYEIKSAADSASFCNPAYNSDYINDVNHGGLGLDYSKSTARTNYYQMMPCVRRGTFEQYVNGIDSMVVVVPGRSEAGAVTVRHYNGADDWQDEGRDYAEAKAKFTYYDKPVIDSVEPQNVSLEGGAWITLTGKNFGKSGVPTVTVNGIKSNCVTRVSDSKVQAMVPAQLAAVSGAEVSILPATNAGAPEVPRTMNITAVGSPKPTISTVSPSTSAKAGGGVITITGTNFGSTLPGVTVGGVCAKVTANSATSITIEAPAQDVAEAKDVVVYSAAGGGTKVGGLTYTASNGISSVSPTTAASTEVSQTVTISGTGLGTSGTVTIGGVAVTPSSWTATSIVVAFTPSTVGANAIVVNPTGATTPYRAAIKVTGPVITYVGPEDDSGEVAARFDAPDADTSGSGETLSVVALDVVKIKGTGFGTTEGVVKVGSATVSAADVTWSDTTITFPTPDLAEAVYDVTVEPAPSGRQTATRTQALSIQIPATAPLISSILATDFPDNGNDLDNQFDQEDVLDSNIFVIRGEGFLGTDNGASTSVQWLDHCVDNGEYCDEAFNDFEVISLTDTEITIAVPRDIEEYVDWGGTWDWEENRHLNYECTELNGSSWCSYEWRDFMDVYVTTDVGMANRWDGLEYLNLIEPDAPAKPTVSPTYGLCKKDPLAGSGSVTHTPATITISDESADFGSFYEEDIAGVGIGVFTATQVDGINIIDSSGTSHSIFGTSVDTVNSDDEDLISISNGNVITLNLNASANSNLTNAIWGASQIQIVTDDTGTYTYPFACKVQVTPVVATSSGTGTAGDDVSSLLSVTVPGLVLSDTFTSPGADGGSAYGYRRSDWSGNGLTRGFTRAANLTSPTNTWDYYVRQQWGTFGGPNSGTGGADANNRYIFTEATKASIHLSGVAISPTPVVAAEILNHGPLVGAISAGSGIDVTLGGSMPLAGSDAVTSLSYKYINTACESDPNERWKTGLPNAVAPETCNGDPARGTEGTWKIGIASIKIEGGGEDHTSWYVSTPGTATVKILRRPVTLTPTMVNSIISYKGQLQGDGTTSAENDISYSVGDSPADPVTSVTYEYINTDCLNATRPVWTTGVPKNVATTLCSAADSTPGTAGTWTVRVKSFKMEDSGTDVSSWYTPTKGDLVVTINPLPLTLTGTSANKVWDGNDSAKLNIEVTGAVTGETPKVDLSGDNAATYSQSDAGADLAVSLPNSGAIVLQGDDKWNYTIAPLSGVTGTIKKADAVIGLSTPKTALKFVSGNTFDVTATVEDARGGSRPSGWGDDEPVAWSSKTESVCTVAAGVVTHVSAGECIIEASQPATKNYNAAKALSDATKTKESITIQLLTTKTLAVVANDDVTDYASVADEVYTPGYQMMGLFGDDSFDGVEFTFTRDSSTYTLAELVTLCDTTPLSCIGTYSVVPSGGTGTFEDPSMYSNGDTPKLIKGRLIITALPPVITMLSPAVGPEAGGTSVTITGEHLDTVTSVVIGDVTIRQPNFTVNGDGTEITFLTPEGYGLADVTLNAGAATAVDTFTYEAPDEPQIAVTAISDQYGPSTGGFVVTATGSHLDLVTKIKIGTVTLYDSEFTASGDGSQITFTMPAGAGTKDVEFFGPWNTATESYVYKPDAAPELNLNLNLNLGGKLSGSDAVLTGGGLMAFSEYNLQMFSTVVTIYTGTSDVNGNFSQVITVPAEACIEPGRHRFVLSGIAPDGSVVDSTQYVSLDDACRVWAISESQLTQAKITGFLFGYNSAKLTKKAKKSLRQIAPMLKEGTEVIIYGYTQTNLKSKASKLRNKKLAHRRTVAVRKYLRAQGVTSVKYTLKSKGAVSPVSTKKQYKNRRVSITVKFAPLVG